MDDHKPFTIRYDHKSMQEIVACHVGINLNMAFTVKRLWVLTSTLARTETP